MFQKLERIVPRARFALFLRKSNKLENKIWFMEQEDFRIYAKYYDQIYSHMKNYEKEAKIVENTIRKFESEKSKTLLDVGCGTGEHLTYLSLNFKCTGIDINRNMIKIARDKVPNARFNVASMIDFKLGERFDVITCLFSAIGHVQTFDNLVRTISNFYGHSAEKGLVIVEPWIFKKDFIKGHIGLNIHEDENIKLARMSTSKMTESKRIIYMHYLVGEKGEVKHFTEIHEMLASDCKDYVEAFKSAGFTKVEYLTDDLWDGSRGLFIAKK